MKMNGENAHGCTEADTASAFLRTGHFVEPPSVFYSATELLKPPKLVQLILTRSNDA